VTSYDYAASECRSYRAHFHHDHFHDEEGNEFCQGEHRSRIDELERIAGQIQEYGYKIVIRFANTDHPKVSMVRYLRGHIIRR